LLGPLEQWASRHGSEGTRLSPGAIDRFSSTSTDRRRDGAVDVFFHDYSLAATGANWRAREVSRWRQRMRSSM